MTFHSLRRLLAAIRTNCAKRRIHAELRVYDPRLLKDIGLRWERGRLVAINPEREPAVSAKAAGPAKRPETCPSCGARLT